MPRKPWRVPVHSLTLAATEQTTRFRLRPAVAGLRRDTASQLLRCGSGFIPDEFFVAPIPTLPGVKPGPHRKYFERHAAKVLAGSTIEGTTRWRSQPRAVLFLLSAEQSLDGVDG